MKLDWNSLSVGDLFVASYTEDEYNPHDPSIWVTRCTSRPDEFKEKNFIDILDIKGDGLIDAEYTYSEHSFNEEIKIIKMITQEEHPEYFL